MLVSKKRRIVEIVGVVATAIGKFVFMDLLDWRFFFVAIAVLFWSIYLFLQNKEVLIFWGFRKDTFLKCLKLVVPFVTFACASFIVIGYIQGTINIKWHILPILLSYPIWGVIQQYLVIALVAGNLYSLKVNKKVTITLTAILFSVVHYPTVWLMVGTFVLALYYGYVYLRVKNIYVLGLIHGWLGALFYYTVVGSDPFKEVFLTLI